MLLDGGLDVNLAAADGATALLASLYNWDPPDTTFVPGKGAPAQAGSSQKFGPDLKMARFLLDRGATVKAADSAGYTPLHGRHWQWRTPRLAPSPVVAALMGGTRRCFPSAEPAMARMPSRWTAR